MVFQKPGIIIGHGQYQKYISLENPSVHSMHRCTFEGLMFVDNPTTEGLVVSRVVVFCLGCIDSSISVRLQEFEFISSSHKAWKFRAFLCKSTNVKWLVSGFHRRFHSNSQSPNPKAPNYYDKSQPMVTCHSPPPDLAYSSLILETMPKALGPRLRCHTNKALAHPWTSEKSTDN